MASARGHNRPRAAYHRIGDHDGAVAMPATGRNRPLARSEPALRRERNSAVRFLLTSPVKDSGRRHLPGGLSSPPSRGRSCTGGILAVAMATCPLCDDFGWVCENHPNRPWEGHHACTCGGAGMPCFCNGSDELSPPRCQAGSRSTQIAMIKGGCLYQRRNTEFPNQIYVGRVRPQTR